MWMWIFFKKKKKLDGTVWVTLDVKPILCLYYLVLTHAASIVLCFTSSCGHCCILPHTQLQLRSEKIDIHQSIETQETAGLENSVLNEIVDMQESVNQVENWLEEDIEHERRDQQQSTEGGCTDWHEDDEPSVLSFLVLI